MLRMRILAGLYLWGERLIVATAQNREVSRETFNQVADLIEAVPFLRAELAHIRRANGQEEIKLKSGARYKIVAPNGGARGLSADLVIIDELREHKDDIAFAALSYTMTARPNPQMWLASNAGDASSVVLNRIREQAMRSIADGKSSQLLWMEWSAAPGCRVDDRKAWQAANPALGHTISEDVLEARMTDRHNVIRTEMLCQWVDTLESPWGAEDWARGFVEDLTLKPGAPTWFAVDFTWDRTGCVLVGAQQLPNGKIGVGLIQEWKSEAAMDAMPIAGEVAEWAKKYSARAVAMLKDGAMHLAPILAQARIPVSVLNFSMYAQACDELLAALSGDRISHAGQPVLTDHMSNVARSPVGEGGWRIARRDANSPVQAAVALALAVHHATPRSTTATIISA
jgi:phage terminase large subunit-like protein